MNDWKLGDGPEIRTICGVGLVEESKLGEEIRRIVGLDEVINEGHCSRKPCRAPQRPGRPYPRKGKEGNGKELEVSNYGIVACVP